MRVARLVRLRALCFVSMVPIALGWPLRAGAQAPKNRVVPIYTDYPAPGQTDRRSRSESHYDFFFFMPAEKADDISVRPDYPVADLDEGKTGTCIEYRLRFGGPNEFASAAFKPAGGALGTRPGLAIDQQLNAAPGQRIFLRFRARRRANDQATVGFRVGGLALGRHVDSVRPPASPQERFVVLSADWVEYSIDLTKRDLRSVVSPFSVTAQSNDNRGKEEIVFYVDDIRFVAE